MRLSPFRGLFLLAFLLSVPVLAGSLYLQHGVGLQPCPLAILQRLCLVGFALACLAAALHGPASFGARVYALVALFCAGAGAIAAGRQIWLQDLPGGQPPRALSVLDGLLSRLPLHGLLRLVLQGTGECGEVSWSLLGLSVPEWSLLAFAGLLLVSLWPLLRRA
jgi:disulfide bond formation protein DsbB